MQSQVDLTALLLEEKQRVLDQVIAQFQELGDNDVVMSAQKLCVALEEKDYKKELDLAEPLRNALLKARDAKPGWFSWFSDSSPALREAGYVALKALVEYWHLNNRDDQEEAIDCSTLDRMSCRLYVVARPKDEGIPRRMVGLLLQRTQEEYLRGKAANLLSDSGAADAYIFCGDDLYYVNKVPRDFAQYNNNPTIRVTKLPLQDFSNLPRLKAILGITATIEALAQQSRNPVHVGDKEAGLRQIQMLYIKRFTGHDSYQRCLLSSGRQRDMDALGYHFRRDPSDPETREMFSEREREDLREQARLRYQCLVGNDQDYEPILRIGQPSRANQRVRVGSEGSSSNNFWGGLMTTVGLVLYCAGLVAINIFTGGALVLASLAAVVVGIVMLLGGLTMIGREESAVDDQLRPPPGGEIDLELGRPAGMDALTYAVVLNMLRAAMPQDGARQAGVQFHFQPLGQDAGLFPGLQYFQLNLNPNQQQPAQQPQVGQGFNPNP